LRLSRLAGAFARFVRRRDLKAEAKLEYLSWDLELPATVDPYPPKGAIIVGYF